MSALMGLKTRLNLAKTLAITGISDESQLGAKINVLATSGTAIILLKTDISKPADQALATVAENAGFDTIIGLFNDSNTQSTDDIAHQQSQIVDAQLAGVDTVVVTKMPAIHVGKYGLSGLWVADQNALLAGLANPEIDYLIVEAHLVGEATRLAPPDQRSSKPWFSYAKTLDESQQQLNQGSRRIAFPIADSAEIADQLRTQLNQAWRGNMEKITFLSFLADS